MIKVKRRQLMLCGVLFIGLLFIPLNVNGAIRASNDLNVLVVFSSKDEEIDEHQRLLDMLISHFTTNLSFISSKEVREEDLTGVTHLFYYGYVEEALPDSFISMLSSYSGPFIAIGHNVEQLELHFSYIDPVGGMEKITEIEFLGNKERKITTETQHIVNITIDEKADVVIEAKHDEDNYPLFVQKNNTYYYATNNLFPPTSNFFAEILHDVFDVDHDSSTKAYLRLEDIHPRVDPNYVRKIAEILQERDIPYMASIVPVYVNSKTEEEYHLSETPKLVEALKYMQDNGGSLIFHGYTDQYHLEETGGGFEFWNVKENMPIYHNPYEKKVIKSREDFAKDVDFETYIEEKKAFETDFIQNRLNRGLEELVDYGLYPIAFEAPHYAMSQNGYRVVSEYFSTYVGQIQLTDEDWMIMTESPNISEPTFLHGMKLLPETIRYVRYEEPASIQEMKNRINDFSIVRDGIIGGFYHPFLGVNGLLDLVNEMEQIPDLEWMDLKEMDHTVKTDNFEIRTENGEVVLDKDEEQLAEAESSSGLPLYLLKLSQDNMLWLLAGACTTGFMAFLSYFLLKQTRRVRRSEG